MKHLLHTRSKISTHAPRMGATAKSFLNCVLVKFSTHTPREGSDLDDIDNVVALGVSTHAPAWGATANVHKSLLTFAL